MRLTFLGTGASGRDAGEGRSRRRESSLLVEAGGTVLLDVTRHFVEQAAGLRRLDAILLTHAHRDAAGGVPGPAALVAGARSTAPAALAPPEAVAVLRRRHRRLEHVDLVAVEPGEGVAVGALRTAAAEVPHVRDPRFRTYAWRLSPGRTAVAYASDVARLEAPLERLARSAGVLAVDGAMWRRTLFAHLTIDRELPRLCRWPVGRSLLTQIGRSVPPHEEIERSARELCPHAAPAWDDGLVVEVGP